MQADQDLQTLIQDVLLRDNRLSEQSVEVSVSAGTVTLRGTVQSYVRKLAAREVVASIDGVTDLADELRVVPPGQLADEEIAEFVRRALEARADVTRPTIAVTVDNGAVKLSGTVGNHWERVLAEDAASGTKGVVEVKNLLLIDLDAQIEDEALGREIQERLAHTRGLRQTNVRATVTGETAVLSGILPELWQKDIAASVARRFRVRHVNNNIVVAGTPQP